MVFHLPNEDALRMTNNYSEMFALTILWNIGLLGILVAVLFILCYILKKYQLKIQQNQLLKDSMLTAQERSSRNLPTNELNLSITTQNELTIKSTLNPTTKLFAITNTLTSIFYYLLWIIATLIYLGFYMFNFFGRGTYIDVLSVFAITLAVVIPTLIWKYYTKVSPLAERRRQIIVTVVLLSIWLGISVFMVVLSKGACLCYFNDRYGFKVEKDLSLSTDFTRLMTLDQVCRDEEVCHLYATVPEDPSTAVFFNAHSGMSLPNLTFTLRKDNAIIHKQSSNLAFKLQNVQSIGQRHVHSILITDLTPNTLYSIELTDPKGKSLKITNYKTTPAFDTKELKIAAGGDIGMTKYGQLIVSHLKYFNPDIILIGGDTVYDNGLRSCYYSWDNFYAIFEPVYAHLDRLVPLVMTIGNHDVGYDALNPVNIDLTEQAIPLFFALNPQHLAPDGKSVPKILERESYHYHLIGPTIHFHLDSGYLKGYKDQISFVQNNIRTYPEHYRFANYHNPIFPSCTDSTPGSNDVQVIENGKKYWVPLFDKWSFTAVLEHHTHHRKMTYLLKNSTKNPEGTRYIGDGSWGVTNMTCNPQQIPSFIGLIEDYETNDAPNHFWQIVLTPTQDPTKPYSISYTAVDMGRNPVVQKTDSLTPVKDEEL